MLELKQGSWRNFVPGVFVSGFFVTSFLLITMLPVSAQQTARRARIPALSALNSAIEKNPGDAMAWYRRADAETNGLEDRKAVRDYTKVIELQKDSAAAYLRRGQCLANLGEFTKAEADFYHALDAASVSKDRNNILVAGDAAASLTLRLKGRASVDELIALWARVVKLTNHPRDYFRRGEYELSVSRLDMAEKDLKESQSLGNPENVECLRALGECAVQQKRYKEAIQYYSTAIDLMRKKKWDFSIRRR